MKESEVLRLDMYAMVVERFVLRWIIQREEGVYRKESASERKREVSWGHREGI